MATLSVLVLAGLFYTGGPRVMQSVQRDPVLYLGAVFLLLLLVQSLNSGYMLYQTDAGAYAMRQLPPRWLPWSVEPKTASQMLYWFFPAYAAVLVIRHGLSRDDIWRFLYLLVWNSGLMALFGIVQYLVHAEKIAGMVTVPGSRFFAVFTYLNHAGGWFYLSAALAGGLLFRAINRRMPAVQTGVWGACFVLCITAAFLSMSRAAALAGTVVLIAFMGEFLRRALQKGEGSRVINLAGVAGIVLLLAAVLYFGAGKGKLAKEIRTTVIEKEHTEILADRAIQYPGAWDIARNYPLFGCGGWGYRWAALLYIPEGQEAVWSRQGKANVHCDPLQFLCEFGWIGSLLMAGVVGVLLFDAVKAGSLREIHFWIGLGLLLTWFHSWIDLPFRCPAILMTWCALLAALPRIARPAAPHPGIPID